MRPEFWFFNCCFLTLGLGGPTIDLLFDKEVGEPGGVARRIRSSDF